MFQEGLVGQGVGAMRASRKPEGVVGTPSRVPPAPVRDLPDRAQGLPDQVRVLLDTVRKLPNSVWGFTCEPDMAALQT